LKLLGGDINSSKQMERNNSVFSRKELIKKEYNRIIETRLPNILQLMNQDKRGSGGNNGLIEQLFQEKVDYDDTELLSKMFSKD
jgi:hypothetical protein